MLARRREVEEGVCHLRSVVVPLVNALWLRQRTATDGSAPSAVIKVLWLGADHAVSISHLAKRYGFDLCRFDGQDSSLGLVEGGKA